LTWLKNDLNEMYHCTVVSSYINKKVAKMTFPKLFYLLFTTTRLALRPAEVTKSSTLE
jgi:hypothetical protein